MTFENQKKLVKLIWLIILIIFCEKFYKHYVEITNSSYFTGCQVNMKNFGDTLNNHAIAHDNCFPKRDSEDFQNIVNSFPSCRGFMRKNRLKKIPVNQNPYYLGYEVDSIGYRYTLCCKGENHINLGVNADYPLFSSVYGVLSGGDYNYNQTKPLYTAVYENSPSRVKELLATKPDLSKEVDTLGRTPLHTAAAFGYTDIAEMLIAYGVDINPRDEWGWTPLKWAKSRNRSKMIKLLKKHGATE